MLRSWRARPPRDPAWRTPLHLAARCSAQARSPADMFDIFVEQNSAGDVADFKPTEGVTLRKQDGRPAFTFEREDLRKGLRSRSLGRTVLCAAALPSTQALLAANRNTLPLGTVVVADVQTQGQGRGSSAWSSPEGCLMASVLLHNRMEGHKVPFLQYVGCLAVVAALQELFAQRLGDAYVASDFPIRIKWPNDVHVTRPDGTSVKLGGILGQTVSGRGAHSTVMGVGLNVTNAEPTTCANSVLEDMASRHGIGVEPLSRGTVLAAVLNHFEVFMQILEADGFQSLQGTYRRYWLHEGQRLRVHDDTGSTATEVTICGIGENAFLLGRDDSGNVCELHYDTNSLDLMQGMIKRKQ